jgi:hypothetical protein
MLKTAKAWGLTPLQWRQQPADDQALMLAFDLFESTREAYRQEYQENWRKKHQKGGGPGNEGNREFRAMQRERAINRRYPTGT